MKTMKSYRISSATNTRIETIKNTLKIETDTEVIEKAIWLLYRYSIDKENESISDRELIHILNAIIED